MRVATSAGTDEYTYDAQGRRISTWQTSDDFGNEGRIYWGRKQIAFRNGPTFFEHQSYLGTERMRTSYQGAVAATEVSLFYGDDFVQTVSVAFSDEDNNQFAGQEYDAESGSQHAQFRQYSSTQGWWMSPDPYDGSYSFYNPQSLNRYLYAKNNPLFAIDPSGLEATDGCGDGDDTCDGNNDGGGDGGGDGSSGGGDGSSGGGDTGSAPDQSNTIYVSVVAVTGTVDPTSYTVDFSDFISFSSPFSQYFGSAPSNGQVPVHGLWTYGNYCGAGGMGTPINGTDAACAAHDACYNGINLTADQYTSGNLTPGQVQGARGCNQQLCNAVLNVNRGSGIPFSQRWAGAEIILFFSLTGPQGARCQGF